MKINNSKYIRNILICLLIIIIPCLIYIFCNGGLHSLAIYPDFIATDLAYRGFNKKLELRIIQLFLIILFIVLPIMIFYNQKLKLLTISLKNLFYNTVIYKKYLNTKMCINKYHNKHILIATFLYLIYFLFNPSATHKLLIVGIIIGNFIIIVLLKSALKFYIHVIIHGICLFFSLFGSFIALKYLGTINTDFHSYIKYFVAITLLYSFFICKKLTTNPTCLRNYYFIGFICTPLILFAVANTSYIYNNCEVHFFNSQLNIHIAPHIILIAILINFILWILKKYSIIISISALSLAIYFVWIPASPYFMSDMFHYGEMTVPLQQLINYGSIPFVDYFPVHGIMDYFYYLSGIVFSDNTYSAINIGISIGRIITALIVFIVFSLVIKNKYYLVLLSIIGLCIDLRWLSVLISLPILIKFYFYKQPSEFFSVYIWLSLCSILWYPALGGCLAISVFPLVLYNFIKYKIKISLLAIFNLIAFITALFLLKDILIGILKYVFLTSSLSIPTHGTSIIDGTLYILTNKYIDIIKVYSFMVALLLFYIYSFIITSKLKVKYFLLAFSLSIFTILLSNYTFLRFDTGSRLYSLNYLLIFILLPAFASKIQKFKIYNTYLVLLCCLCFSNFTSLNCLYDSKQIQISDNYVLPSEQEKKLIGNLGNIYIDKKELSFLLDLRSYFDANLSSSFFLLSSQLALYNILNFKCYQKFATSMNMEGIKKQKNNIYTLEKNNINIAVLSNKVPSFRPPIHNYYTYLYLLKKGFKFDKIIQDTILMKKNDTNSLQLKNEYIFSFFHQYFYPKRMINFSIDHLPLVWAGALNKTVKVDIKKNERIVYDNKMLHIIVNFDAPININDFDLLSFSIDINSKKTKKITLCIDEFDINSNNYPNIEFFSSDRTSLIPIWANPHWLFNKNIKSIHLYIEYSDKLSDFKYKIGFQKFTDNT